jgi:magnesium-transporting ATPase (P-type)
LRTLLLAQKSLDEATYTDWARRYRAALTDLAELEKKEKELPNLIEKTMGELEHGLLLVGSTAIEDKLQDGVPQAIADLGRAGIAVWVLTGDKEETAINIAFACELFDTRTTVLVLNLKSHPTAKEVLAELTKSGKAAAGSASSGGKHALVIDGEVISLVMADKKLQLAMLELTQNCQSVVACRCAPSQKAQLVSLVKVNVKGAITLAIGDGANDVAMIQAAHIGVGISGQEGMQAANSADFSFAQFRFLLPLLLQHGRNHYRRMSTLTIYIFYKNIVFVLP